MGDLIENNRRRIKLLDAAARLLYEEWFVRFQFPGHEHTRIVDGIPKAWQRGTIGNVCSEFIDGDWIETKDQSGDAFCLIQVSNIGMGDFVETGNHRYISEETFHRLNCTEVSPGDILISRMPKPVGRAWLVTEMPWHMVTAVDITIARPKSNAVNPFYYVYHLNSTANLALCEVRATGATRARITRKIMAELPIALPPISLQLQFVQFAESCQLTKTNLLRQNKALRRDRNLLLPRLMSGEVEV
jgi:type I restriction enzyme, S subunit